jgi:hypothetical protein
VWHNTEKEAVFHEAVLFANSLYRVVCVGFAGV